MSRAVLDNAVRDDLEENGPSSISEIGARIGYPHSTVGRIVARLTDDGVLCRVGTMPGSYNRTPTPVYWFAVSPPFPVAQDANTPAPRMADTPDPIARLALVFEYPRVGAFMTAWYESRAWIRRLDVPPRN